MILLYACTYASLLALAGPSRAVHVTGGMQQQWKEGCMQVSQLTHAQLIPMLVVQKAKLAGLN